MLANEPRQAGSATMAIGYITVGALMDVWTVVFWYYQRNQNATGSYPLWCAGFFFTGLVLIGIGLFVGRIGRSAREAEVVAPPNQVIAPMAAVPQQGVATNGVPITAPQTAPGVMPTQPRRMS